MILAALCGLASLTALAVGAWAIETRLTALARATQRRHRK